MGLNHRHAWVCRLPTVLAVNRTNYDKLLDNLQPEVRGRHRNIRVQFDGGVGIYSSKLAKRGNNTTTQLTGDQNQHPLKYTVNQSSSRQKNNNATNNKDTPFVWVSYPCACPRKPPKDM